MQHSLNSVRPLGGYDTVLERTHDIYLGSRLLPAPAVIIPVAHTYILPSIVWLTEGGCRFADVKVDTPNFTTEIAIGRHFLAVWLFSFEMDSFLSPTWRNWRGCSR